MCINGTATAHLRVAKAPRGIMKHGDLSLDMLTKEASQHWMRAAHVVAGDVDRIDDRFCKHQRVRNIAE